MALDLGLIFAVLAYSAATFLAARTVFDQSPSNPKLLFSCALVAIVSQLFAAREVIYLTGEPHLSLVTMCLLISAFISAALTARSLQQPNLMILSVAYGFSALLNLVWLFVPADSLAYQGGIVASSLALGVHIVLSVVAYCVLIIACLYAIQFRYIDAKLKSKSLSLHSHLPALATVENQLFRLLAFGVAILSLALATGFAFLDTMWSTEYAHKTVLSLMAWAIFLAVATGHKLYGWRGTKSAVSTIIAAFILSLAYFGSRFVKEILLS